MAQPVHPKHEHCDDAMWKVEVNLDDATPEWLAYVMEKLLRLGVNDVYGVPCVMKKGRLGTLLVVLTHERNLSSVIDLLFSETTTLGLRYYPVTVYRLARRWVKVETPWGWVRVKIGLYRGRVTQTAPEYEDCRAIAEQYGVPLKTIYEAAVEAARAYLAKTEGSGSP